MPHASTAFIGSYCSNTVQMVWLGDLPRKHVLVAADTRSESYYENMVSGYFNSSYRYARQLRTAASNLLSTRTPPPSSVSKLQCTLCCLPCGTTHDTRPTSSVAPNWARCTVRQHRTLLYLFASAGSTRKARLHPRIFCSRRRTP